MQRKYLKYLDWIRGLDCSVCCVRGSSEAHHFIGEFHVSGVGLKAPDYLAMPICRNCHSAIHMATPGWKDRQREALIRTIIRAFEAGMIEVFGYGTDDPLQTKPLERKTEK